MSWFRRRAPRVRLAVVRLGFEQLEDRITPALNIAISSSATMNVSSMDMNVVGVPTRFFTASASGANLDVGDIKAALVAGLNVDIKPGIGGAEMGTITWLAGADLDFDGITGDRSLQLTSVDNSISISSDLFDSNPGGDNLDLDFSASTVSGSVDLSASSLTDIDDLTVFGKGINVGPVAARGFIGFHSFSGIGVFGGQLSTQGGNIGFIGNVALQTDTVIQTTAGGAAGGNVLFLNSVLGSSADTLTIQAGQGDVVFQNTVGFQIADLDVTAHQISVQAGITLAGPATTVTFTGDVAFGNPLTVNLSGLGAGSRFVLQGGDVTTNGALTITLPGTTDEIGLVNATFDGGADSVSTNGRLVIGDGTDPALLAGTGTLTADRVVVAALGRIAPAGVGTIGTLTLVAANGVAFDAGGVLDSDLGATSDLLTVTGAVAIDSAARLDGSGILPDADPQSLLQAATLTGMFAGTTPPDPFVLGIDAVTASYSGTQLQVTKFAGGTSKTVRGVTEEGDLYTIQLVGGGQLVVIGQPGGGIKGLLVRHSKVKTVLNLNIKANGGSGKLKVEDLRIDGAIGAIKGAKADLAGDNRITGYLKEATVHDLKSGASLAAGGAAGQKSKITGNKFSGDLELGSKLDHLNLKEYDAGKLKAAAVGAIKTTGKGPFLKGDFNPDVKIDAGSPGAKAVGKATIAGDITGAKWDIQGKTGPIAIKGKATDWKLGDKSASAEHADKLGGVARTKVAGACINCDIHTTGRVASLVVGAWDGGTITAQSLGLLQVGGNPDAGPDGSFTNATVTLTGNLSGVALGNFTATGSVQGSTFNIQAGSVTSFTAARFLASKLYIGLSPGGSLTAGTFVGNFLLGTFRTTAQPQDPPNPGPATDGFAASEVCASRFGIVRLSGVTIANGGVPFGLRVASAANAGSVRVATLPFVSTQNVAIGTVQGDFEFIALA